MVRSRSRARSERRHRMTMRRAKRHLKRLMALAAGAAITPLCPAAGSVLDQPLYPPEYPWNQNISQAPVATNSAAIITRIGSSVPVHPDWGEDNSTNGTSPLYGIPYNVVHGNSTTKINITIDNYPGESDIVAVPIPANAVIEGDYQNGPNPNGGGYNTDQRGDSHLIVWDEDNNVGYELYGVTRPSDTTLFPNTSGVELAHTDGKWHAAQETIWHFGTDGFRTLGETSADAAGLSILAGLARPEEGLPTSQGGQGAINHALRMTLPPGDVSSQYIYPASHMVSKSGTIPLGTRFRLKNTTQVNNLIAAMGPQSQIVARAMQQYGLILADVGSAMYVSGASASVNATNGISLVWNMSDVLKLNTLTAANFEVVSLAPVVTGLGATNGAAGSNLIISGENFTGAAGHLSVFFGTNVANSVAVLSDTQVSVTVPGGSGTVDVKVQSGVNETDNISNSPNANVNAPIFGYGTSAVTQADKFTYTVPAPTIKRAVIKAGNLILSGTNNAGASGTYHVLASTNLLAARTNWTVLGSGSFDGSGNFSFTNTLGTNKWQFYCIQVP